MKKNNSINVIKNVSLGLLIAVTLSACASAPQQKRAVGHSYLKNSAISSVTSNDTMKKSKVLEGNLANEMQVLSPYKKEHNLNKPTIDLTEQFSALKMVKITADELPLEDYLHHVLGELLGVNYILGDKVKSASQNITLNLQEPISQQKLFTISETLLAERGYIIRFNDDIYYIHDTEGKGAKGNLVYGYGNKIDDVPNSSLDIMQMIPFDYGVQSQLTLIIKSLAKVKTFSAAANI